MTEKLTNKEMAWELARQVNSKRKWLMNFSSGKRARPQWEIQARKEQLEVLEQAYDHYAQSAKEGSS